jgi:hypothetical protein
MDNQADHCQSSQQKWIEERLWRHDNTPSHDDERGLFYRIGSLSIYPLAAGTGPNGDRHHTFYVTAVTVRGFYIQL